MVEPESLELQGSVVSDQWLVTPLAGVFWDSEKPLACLKLDGGQSMAEWLAKIMRPFRRRK